MPRMISLISEAAVDGLEHLQRVFVRDIQRTHDLPVGGFIDREPGKPWKQETNSASPEGASEAAIIDRTDLSELRCAVCTGAQLSSRP